MRKVLFLILLFCYQTQAELRINDRYAAIAYSLSSGEYHIGLSQSTIREAEINAIEQCKSTDCFVRAAVQNGCLSFARDAIKKNLGFGSGWTAPEAEEDALFLCQRPWSKNCAIVMTFCTH